MTEDLARRARAREHETVLDETVLDGARTAAREAPGIVLLVVALAALVVGVLIARWWRGATSRRRNRIAQGGEHEAERILARAGYRVVERQARAAWSMIVDGEELEIEVRADLIVSRRDRLFVAEVKTGERAPDPTHPPTRRQLLEYSLVFGADAVLLVDVPARAVRAVSFRV